MRALFGRETPKEAAEATKGLVLIARTNLTWASLIVAVIDSKSTLIALAVSANVIWSNRDLFAELLGANIWRTPMAGL